MIVLQIKAKPIYIPLHYNNHRFRCLKNNFKTYYFYDFQNHIVIQKDLTRYVLNLYCKSCIDSMSNVDASSCTKNIVLNQYFKSIILLLWKRAKKYDLYDLEAQIYTQFMRRLMIFYD